PLNSTELLKEWVRSNEAQELVRWHGRPTVGTRESWARFMESLTSEGSRVWHRAVQKVDVRWYTAPPERSVPLWVEESSIGELLAVTPDLSILGQCTSELQYSKRDVVGVRLSGAGTHIE